MGTRSIIVIHGKARYGTGCNSFRLYKHWDGYPTGNLPIIAKALARAIDVSVDCLTGKPLDNISPEVICGFIIGEATCESGMGAHLEYKGAALDEEALGNQGDLEWVYVIDAQERTVKLYNSQSDVLKGREADPFSYVKQLVAGAQEQERTDTERAIGAVELTGFKVNPKPAPSNIIQLAPKDPFKVKSAPKRKGSRLQPWQVKGGDK